MPPRKSDARKSDVSAAAATAGDASQVTAGEDSVLSTTTTTQAGADRSISEGASSGPKKGKEAATAAGDNDKTTIEDLTLPKSIITRLAKGVLPANTQIQANAIMAMSKSTTVFISYLAAHANEITLNANKKTIMPADVFKALEEIEFDFLKEPLEAEFAKFNAIQTDKRNTYRQKVKAAAKPTAGDDTDMGGGGADSSLIADTTIASAPGDGGDNDDAPPSKKARVEGSGADADETEVDDGEEDAAAEDMDDEEEDDEEEAEEEEDEDEDEEGRASGDETQDALEERVDRDEADEALDGDESD
ncbi:hypothetical protein LMH87_011526 [Akanthomyces muscarius]|uniref:DNA polymerase epsilon subunit D n=1 Tax=Akanthomyces muscarius TaxID=2231603 RepID=A0A9W8Q9C1_AKAMU|nr:hypothetical protein LMH87_011526 [Akanthomyces muscarius]KAJ4150792.1 hypothetical protein LMH87_011526 [Akanthomyces muscarius]